MEPSLVSWLPSGEVFLVQLPCKNSQNHTDLGLESGRWSLSLIFIPVPTHLGDNDKVSLVSRNPEHAPLECPGSGVHRHCFLESGRVQGRHRDHPSTLTTGVTDKWKRIDCLTNESRFKSNNISG